MRASNVQLTRRLYRVEQQRRALVVDALGAHQLSLPQWMALSILSQEGPSSMTQLAQASGVDRTSLTRTIDGLITRGLVARYTPPQDRRTVMVEATPTGLVLAGVADETVDALERRWLAVLGEAEQASLATLLETLLQGANASGARERANGSGWPASGLA